MQHDGQIYHAPESLSRVSDHERYRANLAAIFGDKPTRAKPGRYVLHKGKLVNVAEIGKALRKRDATQIKSENSGCLPRQIADFNRRFGHLGVKYVKTEENWASAVYEDRAARLRVLKHRGMYDKDEVRG